MYIDGLAKLLKIIELSQSYLQMIKSLFDNKNDHYVISTLQIALGLMADWANDCQFCVSVDKCSVDVAQQ